MRVFSFPLSLLRDDAIVSPSSDLSTAKMVAASNITIATSQRPHPHRQHACQRMSGKKDERGLEGWWEGGRHGGWIIRLERCLQWACSGSIAQRTTKRCAETWSLAVLRCSQQQHFHDKDGANGSLMFVYRHRLCTYTQTDIMHDFVEKMNYNNDMALL